MTRRRNLIAVLVILALAAATTYAVWVIRAASKWGSGWAGLSSAWPYLLAGVLTVAVVIAGFLRLAFFSQSHGYDDRADPGPR